MSRREFDIYNQQLLIQIVLAESINQVIMLQEERQELRKEFTGKL